jgi:hypothetical protein
MLLAIPTTVTAAPVAAAGSGPARLSLITCAGNWEQSQKTYSERLIVTAELMA